MKPTDLSHPPTRATTSPRRRIEPTVPLCYTLGMPITREEVRHIALLARLQLSEAEEAAFTQQLDHILEHFQRLNDLDTDQVEATAHIVPMATPIREDEVRNQSAPEEWLANAPSRDARFFKVPKIIE